MCFSFIPPFHKFPFLSKVRRTIPSWLAYVLKSVSCHSLCQIVITIHQAPSDHLLFPQPSLFLLNSAFWNPLSHCLASLFFLYPSSSASTRSDSTYSGMCFLIPRHRIHGSNIPFANITCYLCLFGCWSYWNVVFRAGLPCHVPSLYPLCLALCLGECTLNGSLWNLVQSLILLCD